MLLPYNLKALTLERTDTNLSQNIFTRALQLKDVSYKLYLQVQGCV